MTIKFHLLDKVGWQELASLLGARQSNQTITANFIKHLRALGAKSVLVENDYLDRDFTEAYAAYYSKLFKRHSKLCTRLLFFKKDLTAVTAINDTKRLASELQKIGARHFLGFITLRIIHQAPIAQAALLAPKAPKGFGAHVLIKAQHEVHALGAQFTVVASPMTQQDQRIGACAQAAIWGAVRHVHLRHKGPWMSMVNISEAANAHAEALVSTAIPSGSEFLSLNGMVSAVRAAGRKPLLYVAEQWQIPPVWNAIRPHEAINRYLDSGIPVMVGLTLPNHSVGHAVLATGQVFAHVPPVALPSKPTRAEFCEAFYINDDQSGTNLRMPVRLGSAIGETNFNVAENVTFLLIPLPDKVFVPAEKAEQLAWDILLEYGQAWIRFKQANAANMGGSVPLGDGFVSEIHADKVVARTYLTYGWKYQYRAIRNNLTDGFRHLVRSTQLPRFVWVTEFGTTTSFADSDRFKRRIFAHCVIDATAKNMGTECRLIFHAPGVGMRNTHDSTDPYGPYKRELYALNDDKEYYPKLRGNPNFDGY